MSDDLVVYGDGAFGREISSGLPESHLAFVDSQHLATRECVARARHYWPERDPADFEVYEHLPGDQSLTGSPASSSRSRE